MSHTAGPYHGPQARWGRALALVLAIGVGLFTAVGPAQAEGTVRAWGNNGNGQLGDGTTVNRPTPVEVGGLNEVVAVVAGAYHSLVLRADGTVWGWGYGCDGQLGAGPFNDCINKQTTPVAVSGLTGVVAVATGESHGLALKADGTVWAWGMSSDGELGPGPLPPTGLPVAVGGLTGMIAVAAGGGFPGDAHSLALKANGTVWAWGSNCHAQLGDPGLPTNLNGPCVERPTPEAIGGLAAAIAVAAAQQRSLAVQADGTVWEWGKGNSTPVAVSGLTGVVTVAASFSHALALKADGTVWAWGANDRGQLGDGTTVDRPTPVAVTGLTDVVAVASGVRHSLALKTDGTVRAWGANDLGQLGDGTTLDRHTPVAVSGLTGVEQVASGYAHSLAIKTCDWAESLLDPDCFDNLVPPLEWSIVGCEIVDCCPFCPLLSKIDWVIHVDGDPFEALMFRFDNLLPRHVGTLRTQGNAVWLKDSRLLIRGPGEVVLQGFETLQRAGPPAGVALGAADGAGANSAAKDRRPRQQRRPRRTRGRHG